MSTAPKHTLGPWTIEDISKGCDFPLIHGGDDSEVAIAYPGDVLGKEPRLDAMYANARLIAAAPDLLGACKLALAALDSGSSIGEGYDVLRAAIVKAEGR